MLEQLKKDPQICQVCNRVFRYKYRSPVCPDCHNLGWKKCQKCRILFISKDGRNLCEEHPSRTPYPIPIKPRKDDVPRDPQAEPLSRFAILTRDDFRCIYCGMSSIEHLSELHVDHLIAYSKDGPSIASNMITSCKRCNLEKAAKSLSKDVVKRIQTVINERNQRFNIPATMPVADPRERKKKP